MLPGIGTPPQFLENVGFVWGHLESFDDVLTLSLICLLFLSLGVRHTDKVIVYPAPSELCPACHLS